MTRELTKEVIKGVVREVEHIVYNNGKRVKRILNPKTGIPEDIVHVN